MSIRNIICDIINFYDDKWKKKFYKNENNNEKNIKIKFDYIYIKR